MSTRRIAITGIDNFVGQELALALAASDGIEHILALGKRKPTISLEQMEYIQLDLRHSMLEEVLESHRVDTICHLPANRGAPFDDENSQENLLGTMQLVSAAANVGIRKFVFQSSLRAYGARHTNPSFIEEPRRVSKPEGDPAGRALFDAEIHLSGQQAAHPEIGFVTLRFAWILGPISDTPMSRYLDRTVAPTILGFDPHFQVLHERDVVRALVHAIGNVDRGVYNIAPEGVLPLSRILRRIGRFALPIPHPIASHGPRLLEGVGLEEPLPIPAPFLRYSVIGSRERMTREMRFEPAHDSEATLDSYARNRHRRAGGPILGALSLLERGAGRLLRSPTGRKPS